MTVRPSTRLARAVAALARAGRTDPLPNKDGRPEPRRGTRPATEPVSAPASKTSPTLRSPRPPFLPPLRRDRVPPPAAASMPPPPPLLPSSPLPPPPAACPKRSRSSLVVTRSRPSPALCPCCRRAWRARCSARRSRAHCLRTVPHRRTASLALRAPTSSMPPPAASVATASVPRLTSPASSHSCRSLSSACQSWNVCSGS